jgi:hypothetical protein
MPEKEAGVKAGYVSAGLPTELKSTVRAVSIRVRTSVRGAGERRSRGAAIGGGRINEAGIVNTSLGQVETMAGYHEVRNTKEAMHDDHHATIFFCRLILLHSLRTLDLSHFNP